MLNLMQYSSGIILGGFKINPPPVICAIPEIAFLYLKHFVNDFTYILVG